MSRSEELFERARGLIPGGVNSPVRAYGAVGGVPPFIASGRGAEVTDEDGRRYVDFVGSWGPLILGHADPDVVEAVKAAAERGTSFGAPTAAEVELASLIAENVPSVDRVRLVNSGTEATMSALRLARGYTGRDKVIKFAGCYHGHADAFLVKAGSGAATFGVPTSPGVPGPTVRDTLLARFNDLDSVKDLVEAHRGEIAALILEPVAGNMGLIHPKEGFLEGLRELTEAEGIVLIFDEVITGFRLGPSGAQGRFGVTPDMTTLGKIIGGGLPVGAYGGRAEIMARLSPDGPVYQAGTLSGNPVAVAAGLATLRKILEPGAYEKLNALGRKLAGGFIRNLAEAGTQVTFHALGSMSCLFFRKGPIEDDEAAMTSDTKVYKKYFHAMLERGIYLAPSQFETSFVSLAHTEDQIDRAISANREVLAGLAE
ncbi:MAG: glutamate-1-semialdehyde 2,1-aminomutase [Planctomycetota bacterium]|jgi:glutamate-1-semialdehyde 2,1-aminomutase